MFLLTFLSPNLQCQYRQCSQNHRYNTEPQYDFGLVVQFVAPFEFDDARRVGAQNLFYRGAIVVVKRGAFPYADMLSAAFVGKCGSDQCLIVAFRAAGRKYNIFSS